MMEHTPPRYNFTYAGSDSRLVNVSFEAETWPEALSHFVQFLRGSGFTVDDNSIGINLKKHVIDPDYTPFITTFQQ